MRRSCQNVITNSSTGPFGIPGAVCSASCGVILTQRTSASWNSRAAEGVQEPWGSHGGADLRLGPRRRARLAGTCGLRREARGEALPGTRPAISEGGKHGGLGRGGASRCFQILCLGSQTLNHRHSLQEVILRSLPKVSFSVKFRQRSDGEYQISESLQFS